MSVQYCSLLSITVPSRSPSDLDPPFAVRLGRCKAPARYTLIVDMMVEVHFGLIPTIYTNHGVRQCGSSVCVREEQNEHVNYPYTARAVQCARGSYGTSVIMKPIPECYAVCIIRVMVPGASPSMQCSLRAWPMRCLALMVKGLQCHPILIFDQMRQVSWPYFLGFLFPNFN